MPGNSGLSARNELVSAARGRHPRAGMPSRRRPRGGSRFRRRGSSYPEVAVRADGHPGPGVAVPAARIRHPDVRVAVPARPRDGSRFRRRGPRYPGSLFRSRPRVNRLGCDRLRRQRRHLPGASRKRGPQFRRRLAAPRRLARREANDGTRGEAALSSRRCPGRRAGWGDVGGRCHDGGIDHRVPRCRCLAGVVGPL